METETPLMLLFVSNGMDQASIISDTRQMLDTALNDVEQHCMLPEEFDKEISLILCFALLSLAYQRDQVVKQQELRSLQGAQQESIPL